MAGKSGAHKQLNRKKNSMQNNKSWLILATICSTLVVSSIYAAKPWWQKPQLQWKPFTALSAIMNTNYSYLRWEFQERKGVGAPKLFAQSMGMGSPNLQKLLVADSSATPVFSEVFTNWSAINYVNSTAISRWGPSSDEYLFIGTSTGLWRLDESTGQFVSVWYWNWDPTFIMSLGNAIIGIVWNYGSESGDHIFTPNEHIRLANIGIGSMWADPLSGKYGRSYSAVKVVATNLSVMISIGYQAGPTWYSFDDGLTSFSPAGVKVDGSKALVDDFFGYSTNVMIFKGTHYYNDGLFIGQLGGTMYPLNCPTNDFGTFFYSPTTRLLIAGNAVGNSLFYAILPPPDQVLPEIQIENAVIVSWSTQYSTTTLEGTTNLTNGVWQEVTSPRVMVGDQIQTAVPTDSKMKVFRLLSP